MTEKEVIAKIAAVANDSDATVLNLVGHDVMDEHLKPLQNHKHLQVVNLSDNRIGSQGVEFLAKIPTLRVLNLYRNIVGKRGAFMLADHPKLQELDLRNNPVMHDGADAVARIPNLTSLKLTEFHIEKRGVEAIINNRKLKELAMSGSGAGDEIAQKLAFSTSIETLDLSGCCLTDEAAKILAQNVVLNELVLTGNTFGKDAADALSRHGGLTRLSLAVFCESASRIFAENSRTSANLLRLELSSPLEEKDEKHLKIFHKNCEQIEMLTAQNRQNAESLLDAVIHDFEISPTDIGFRQNAVYALAKEKAKTGKEKSALRQLRGKIRNLSGGIIPAVFTPFGGNKNGSMLEWFRGLFSS